jgi:GTP cyclohydrolase FolE2
MYVDLPQEYKGTHMSRFVEMLHLLKPEISLQKFSILLEAMKENLDAASAHIEVSFPYFIEKQAPVSNVHPGLMDYNCRIIGSSTVTKRDRSRFRSQCAHHLGLSLFQRDFRLRRPQSARQRPAADPF